MGFDTGEVLAEAGGLCAECRDGTPAQLAQSPSTPSYPHSNDAVRVVSEHIAALGREFGLLDETVRVSTLSENTGQLIGMTRGRVSLVLSAPPWHPLRRRQRSAHLHG